MAKKAEEVQEQVTQEAGEQLVTVFLYKDNNENKGDLWVCVNMKEYRVPRGKPVQVPASVAEVIQNMMAQEASVLDISEANKAR